MTPETVAMEQVENGSRLRTWALLLAVAAAIVLWGLLVFFVLGDRGPGPWDFGQVEDVPGESPYSTAR